MVRIKATDNGDGSWQRLIAFHDNENGFQILLQNDDIYMIPGKGTSGNWGENDSAVRAENIVLVDSTPPPLSLYIICRTAVNVAEFVGPETY